MVTDQRALLNSAWRPPGRTDWPVRVETGPLREEDQRLPRARAIQRRAWRLRKPRAARSPGPHCRNFPAIGLAVWPCAREV